MKINFNDFLKSLCDNYFFLFALIIVTFIVVFVVIKFFNEDE